MRQSYTLVIAVGLIGSLPGDALAGDRNPEPMRAFFAGGNVYQCKKGAWNSLYFTDLSEERTQRQLLSFSGQGGRPRWYFSYGHLWITHFDWILLMPPW
jgi:hypothetical protein